MVFWCEIIMATIQTNRPIRRRIEAEHEKLNHGKIPASAQVNGMSRRISIPDDSGSPWNGVQISQYNMAALANLKGGEKVTAGE